jgi:hypothetical protein
MYLDFEELLAILNARKVRYLVIGGYAVSFHSQPRATKDLDLWVKPDLSNATALYAALAEFGAPLEDLTPADFAEAGSFFRMGTPPFMVDILPEISGVEFDAAWSHRVEAPIDAESSVIAAFISVDDLIAAKLAAGRPQDIADVAAIREVRPAPSQPHAARRRRVPKRPPPRL